MVREPLPTGELITVEEYYRWTLENSVPGLPEAAAAEGLAPLAYMRKYGAFEVSMSSTPPFAQELPHHGAARRKDGAG